MSQQKVRAEAVSRGHGLGRCRESTCSPWVPPPSCLDSVPEVGHVTWPSGCPVLGVSYDAGKEAESRCMGAPVACEWCLLPTLPLSCVSCAHACAFPGPRLGSSSQGITAGEQAVVLSKQGVHSGEFLHGVRQVSLP